MGFQNKYRNFFYLNITDWARLTIITIIFQSWVFSVFFIIIKNDFFLFFIKLILTGSGLFK